jgi:hypothetical protein
VANVRDMDIPKLTAITAPGVSNAQAIKALNIAHIKKNQNMLSASYAMATIRPTIKGAPSTKKYKNETFHS